PPSHTQSSASWLPPHPYPSAPESPRTPPRIFHRDLPIASQSPPTSLEILRAMREPAAAAQMLAPLEWMLPRQLGCSKIAASITAPCSVNALGRNLRCPPRFKITFCDLKADTSRVSSHQSRNMKSIGNRPVIQLNA